MFEKIYNDSISKIKPDSELIELTKKMMLNELDSKNIVKNISFYKYASIVACVVVVISVLTVYPKNIIKDLGSANLSISSGSFESEDEAYFEGITMNKDDSVQVQNVKPNYGNSFSSIDSVNGNISGLSKSETSIGKRNSFLDWIKEIIQWFYELLF